MRAKFFDLRLRARFFFFFSISYNFRQYVCRMCCKGYRRKQADILVSYVFPVVLETLIVSSFFSTFYQKHDFAPDSLCRLQSLIGSIPA